MSKTDEAMQIGVREDGPMTAPDRKEPKHKDVHHALAAVQAELDTIPFNTDNPFFGSRYADWSAIWDYVQPILHRHELYLEQGMEMSKGDIWIWHTAFSHHKSDTNRAWFFPMPSWSEAKNQAQAFGAVLTYMTRYGLRTALMLMTGEDDDANAAGPEPPAKPARRGNGPAKQEQTVNLITDGQRNRIFARMRASGGNEEQVKEIIKKLGFESTKQITQSSYDEIIAKVDALNKE